MKAKAPASSANLGPGFDVLGIAWNLYAEVTVEPAESFSIETSGIGSDISHDQNHLAARIAIEVAGTDKLAIKVHSEIPPARGLGSSTSLIVAAAAAAGSADPFRVAAEKDGHADNAAASVFGGLVTTATTASGPVARRLPLDSDLRAIAVVPDQHLLTTQARSVLPEMVPHVDAVFNLGRMGLLAAGLADASLLLPAATEDRLHQDYRAGLFPEAAGLISALCSDGALAACWSGAGPTIIGFSRASGVDSLGEAAAKHLSDLGISGHVLPLAPDMAGLTIEA